MEIEHHQLSAILLINYSLCVFYLELLAYSWQFLDSTA